jgi:hypothetical protein
MDVSLHALTSALDGVQSASRPGRFTPRERVPGTWAPEPVWARWRELVRKDCAPWRELRVGSGCTCNEDIDTLCLQIRSTLTDLILNGDEFLCASRIFYGIKVSLQTGMDDRRLVSYELAQYRKKFWLLTAVGLNWSSLEQQCGCIPQKRESTKPFGAILDREPEANSDY